MRSFIRYQIISTPTSLLGSTRLRNASASNDTVNTMNTLMTIVSSALPTKIAWTIRSRRWRAGFPRRAVPNEPSGVVLVADRDALTAWPEGAHRGPTGREIAGLISERIAEVAETAVELMGARGLFVTGGDTAAAALRRLGADGVELAGELEPGVPFGCVTGGPRAGLFIATKAGGFGGADLLWQAASKLTSGR